MFSSVETSGPTRELQKGATLCINSYSDSIQKSYRVTVSKAANSSAKESISDSINVRSKMGIAEKINSPRVENITRASASVSPPGSN